MSGRDCVAAAAGLAELASRLELAALALERQARLPEHDFGGLSGAAFRRHVARSALVAAGAVGDVALLAAGLGALGRGLVAAEECWERGGAAGPGTAERLVARAEGLEQRARDEWRSSVERFDADRAAGRDSPEQPAPLPMAPARGFRGAVPGRGGPPSRGRPWSVTAEAADDIP